MIEQIKNQQTNNRIALQKSNLNSMTAVVPKVRGISQANSRFMQNMDASSMRAQFVTFGRTTPQTQDALKIAKEVLQHIKEGKITAETVRKVQQLASPGIEIDGKLIAAGIEDFKSKKTKVALARTLRAMIYATEYKPKKKRLNKYTVRVNNEQILPLIKNKYIKEDIIKTKKFLRKIGVFKLKIDKESGLVKTATVSAKENSQMGKAFWNKDSIINFELQKAYAPKTCARTIKTWSRFYRENEDRLHKMIRNPNGILNQIRRGKAENVQLEGMPHVALLFKLRKKEFLLTPDSKFNRFRQESHGHVLNAFVNGVIDGVNGKKYSIKPSEVGQNIIANISNLTMYFKAINFPKAPSNGNWEEEPFKHSSTHDTAVITNAIKSVRELMHDEELGKSKYIQRIREQLTKTQYGELLADKKSLDKMISTGEKRVMKFYDIEAPNLSGKREDPPERKVDASQIFTVCMAKFHNNPIINAQRKFEVLKTVSKELEGEFGIRRYNTDSYLGANYSIGADSNGINLNIGKARQAFLSEDCSSPEQMAKRNKICGCPKEEMAQWFFFPVMSRAYGTIVTDLIEAKKTIPANMHKRLNKMIEKAHSKQIEYFNKTLGTVSSENAIKSNGFKNERCGIPEAHEFVTTFERNKKTHEFLKRPIHGQNGSLTWAETETLLTFKKMEEVLDLLKPAKNQ